MTTSYSLEEVLERQCAKLRDLETATILIKSKDAMKEEFVKMRTPVSEICNGIETMRKKLDEMKGQNNELRELYALIQDLDRRIVHMEQNVDSELIHDYQKHENPLALSMDQGIISPMVMGNETQKQDITIGDCKKELFKEPEVCPVIPLISKDEYSKIPKYMIGRQPLETINNLIDTINQILKAKYTFLSLGKANARRHGDLNLYLQYKKQDLDVCSDNEYVYFFTCEDYERHTDSKLNKIKLNLLTVLRHCKRLREHRVKNDLQYVVLPRK